MASSPAPEPTSTTVSPGRMAPRTNGLPTPANDSTTGSGRFAIIAGSYPRRWARGRPDGNFARAAEELFISQPAVSTQVRELEESLGLVLLRRGGRRLVLTDAGEAVLAQAQRLFDVAGDLLAVVEELKGLQSGRLVIGASTTACEYVLPDLLHRFRVRYPKVSLRLEVGNTDRIAARVVDGHLDFGCIGDRPEHEGLVIESYLTDEVVIIVPPDDPLAGQTALAPQALNRRAFVLREPGSATRRIGLAWLLRLGVHPQEAIEVGSNEAVKRVVAAGLGVGLISRHAITNELVSGRLTVVALDAPPCLRDLYLIRLAERRPTPAQTAFLHLVRATRLPDGERSSPGTSTQH